MEDEVDQLQLQQGIKIKDKLTLTCDDVPAAGAAHLLLAGLRVVCLQQADDLGVVGDGGAVAGGGEADGHVHTGIVVLPLRTQRGRRFLTTWTKVKSALCTNSNLI